MAMHANAPFIIAQQHSSGKRKLKQYINKKWMLNLFYTVFLKNLLVFRVSNTENEANFVLFVRKCAPNMDEIIFDIK